MINIRFHFKKIICCLLGLVPLLVNADSVNLESLVAPEPAQHIETIPKPVTGIALFGQAKYAQDFKSFKYVNADAPKGGVIKVAIRGTFNSMNQLAAKGVPAQCLFLMQDTLLMRSLDEPFSLYARIAESFVVAPDRSWITFNLNPKAKFHDGSPILAEDVLFSFKAFRDQGPFRTRTYYREIQKAEILGPRQIKFSFPAHVDRQFPLLIGFMPIFSKTFFEGKDPGKTTLEAPMGSGPYKVSHAVSGKHVIYKRLPDYWGRDLPVNVGQNNFDEIRIEYTRDDTVAFEAFRAGNDDLRIEDNIIRWMKHYDFPLVERGRIKKVEVPLKRPMGMFGLVFNTRNPLFKDRRVRQALFSGFDFEWLNKVYYNGEYVRTRSYFANSHLASTGVPKGIERALLLNHCNHLRKNLFEEPYTPPPGSERGDMRAALDLLKSAGWRIRENRLIHKDTGAHLAFEVLLSDPHYERLALTYAKNLERLGVRVTVRTVDSSHYENRLTHFNYDTIIHRWPQSLAPGREQMNNWGSRAADQTGSRNYAGIKDPVVDAMIKKMVTTKEEKEYFASIRALDRVLLDGHYVVPFYHINKELLAYKDTVAFPKTIPVSGFSLFPWWCLLAGWSTGR